MKRLVLVAALATACQATPVVNAGGGGGSETGGGTQSTGGGGDIEGQHDAGTDAGMGGGGAHSGGGSATGGGSSGGGSSGGGTASTGGGTASTGGGMPDAGNDAGTSNADAGTLDAGILAASCFAGLYVNPINPAIGPNYDQFHPVISPSCDGTHHQHIQGVQRVVFLGDSITVGTPPTDLDPSKVYRAILAQKLATLYGLTPPGLGWGAADVLNGVALPAESGDFVSCSKWGARTDDLMQDNHQVTDCIPPDKRMLHHLVIMTMGGNDIDALTKNGGGMMPAETIPQLQSDAAQFVQLLRDAVTWMKDPANVPGGVDIVFSNNYEFTDGTGDVSSCPGATLAGIQPWTDQMAQDSLVVWTEEQYMKVAVDTQSDMIFMLEAFCGHGYKKDDPTALCYRGPNQALWFDLTCIHPDVEGHAALADLFYNVIATQ